MRACMHTHTHTHIHAYIRSMHVETDERLLKALMEQVQVLAHELAPGHVTSVLWALAKLRQKPTNSLFAALSQRISTMSLCLVPGDISTIMWSLTMLGIEADAVANPQKSSFRHVFNYYVVMHHAWHRGRRSNRVSVCGSVPCLCVWVCPVSVCGSGIEADAATDS
jgi:hypothetical protein